MRVSNLPHPAPPKYRRRPPANRRGAVRLTSVLVVAGILLPAFAARARADKPMSGTRAALENTCLLQDQVKDSKAREGLFVGRQILRKVSGIDESPLCSIRTVPELLLVTTAYLGESSLAVARGLDRAEQALGIKRSLLQEIAQLEAALQGPKLADQLVDRSVELSQKVGDSTRQIEEELDRREREGYLNDEAKELIAAARLQLNRARYFQVQAGAGAQAVSDRHSRASNAEKASWVLHSEVGISGDFFEKAPAKILQAVKDIGRSFRLGDDIDDAGKELDFKIARREIKRSDEEARDDAVRLAENLAWES